MLVVLLIPELCPGGQRLTCGPTLSTNQMRPWYWLGAPDYLHVPIQPGSEYQLLFFSALLARRQKKISRSRLGSLLCAKHRGSSGNMQCVRLDARSWHRMRAF